MRDERVSNLYSVKRRLAALFAVTVAAVIAGAVAYNSGYRSSLRKDSENLLLSIQDFKIQQVTYWRTDRLNDTNSLLDSPILSTYLRRFAADPKDSASKSLLAKRIGAYVRNNRYTEAALTDINGRILVSEGLKTKNVCPEVKELITKANASGRPEMGDFHVSPSDKNPHLDLVARAARGPGGKNIFLLLRIDPQDYLYPLIQKWPTNSPTGETLLVRRQGDKIVFISELRHIGGAAMKLQLPGNTADLPAALAFSGKPGIVRGRDYRGADVLAAVNTIPGTNWAIVTKLDMAEVMAGSGRVYLLLLLLALSLLGAAGAGAYLIFRRQAEEYFRSYAELDRRASKLQYDYEHLTAQANDAILIADAKTLRIIESNKKSHEIYGYTDKEFLRLKISDLVPEAGLAAMKEGLERLRLSAGAVIEAAHRRKDGEVFPAEVSSSYASDNGSEYIFAIIRDVSERSRMEQTLRDSEENYRQLFEAESDALLLIDNETGNIKQANNAACVLYGYTSGELLARRNADLSAEPEDTTKVTKTTPLDADKVVVIPLRYHHKKNGEIFPVEITGRFFTRNGRPVHIAAIRDITERKKTEEKLRLSEERLRMAAEAAQFGVYAYDMETGQRSYSPEFLGLFGLPPGSDLPMDTDQVPAAIYPEDREGFIAARRAGNDPLGTGLVEHEFRIILPTGLVRWLRVRGRTIFTGTGAGARPLRANGILQDVTDKKQAEEALQESQDRLSFALEGANDGIWDVQMPTGDVYISPRGCEILGYTSEELPLVIKKWDQLVHPEDLPATKERLDAHIAGRTPIFEVEQRLQTKSGGWKWIMTRGKVITRDDTGQPLRITGTHTDITKRKAAEMELRASEERYRETIEFAVDGILLGSPEGRIIGANSQMQKLTGRSLSQLLGLHISELFSPEELKNKAFKFDLLNKGQTVVNERELMRPDGTSLPVEMHSKRLPDGTYQSIYRDISERKRTEEALRASESSVQKKLTAIMAPEGDFSTLELPDMFDVPSLQLMMDELYKLTNITSAILDINGKVLVASGWQDICTKFHRANPETCRHCLESDTILSKDIEPGTSKSYFCKNNMRDIATPLMVGGRHVGNFFLGQFLYDDDPRDHAFFREQARRHGFDEKEYLAAYDRVPVFSREKVEVLITFYRQVSEMISNLSYGKLKLARALAQSQQAEDRLRENERRLAALFSNLPGIAYRCRNDKNWTMEFLSEGCKKLTGYEIAELVGENAVSFSELMYPEERERIWQETRSALAANRNFQYTYTIRRKDGLLRTVWEQGLGVKGPDGAVEALEGFISDVTELKKAELELERVNRDLIEKKQEMENFLYITTHDLRSPLVNIQGFSQNLEHYLLELKETLAPAALHPEAKEKLELLTGERIPTALKFVLESSRKMDALISALLKVSRLGRVEMKPETVDMNGLIEKVIESMHFQLESAGAEFKHGSLPQCRADAGAVNQLLTNLLDNAIKYRQEGRPLTVSVTGEIKDGMAFYSVSDNGTGITENELGRIWDIFYRSEAARGKKGEGIGLPMVKRIVEKNGGSITAESKPGEGSVFHITLPLAEHKNGKR